MPRKVAHKVSDHSDGVRVVLWRKWAFHIAFYIINFLEGIFIFKPCIINKLKHAILNIQTRVTLMSPLIQPSIIRVPHFGPPTSDGQDSEAFILL
jgi:hypothetical protein